MKTPISTPTFHGFELSRRFAPGSPFARKWAGRYGCTLTARVGLHHLSGNAHPYVSVTGEIVSNHGGGTRVAGGCPHGEIRRYLPDAAGLIPWHLSDERGPMHYEANAVYHWRKAKGWPLSEGPADTVKAPAAFHRLTQWGTLPGDDAPDADPLTWTTAHYGQTGDEGNRADLIEALRGVLRRRLPALLAARREALTAAGIDPDWRGVPCE